MKFSPVLMAAVCVAVLGPATAFGQVAKSGKGYLLRLKFKKGQVHKYSVNSDIRGMSSPMKLGGSMEEEVLSISGKKATVKVKTSAMTLEGGMSVGQPQERTIEVDDVGGVAGGATATVHTIAFPKDPVKVGGTWSQDIDLPAMLGSKGKGKATYRFNGLKRVGKQSVADLTFSIAPTGSFKGGSGSVRLLAADGSLVNLTMKFILASAQLGTDVTATTNITRAKS